MASGMSIASDNLRHSSSVFILLRVVQIRMALLTRTESESEIESDTGGVSFGVGSMRKVETRGKDASQS
jgi:hypothetical protein